MNKKMIVVLGALVVLVPGLMVYGGVAGYAKYAALTAAADRADQCQVQQAARAERDLPLEAQIISSVVQGEYHRVVAELAELERRADQGDERVAEFRSAYRLHGADMPDVSWIDFNEAVETDIARQDRDFTELKARILEAVGKLDPAGRYLAGVEANQLYLAGVGDELKLSPEFQAEFSVGGKPRKAERIYSTR